MGLQTESTKKGTCKHCFKRRERGIQKRAKQILDNLSNGFTAVSLDESFFFFDSLVRKVWIFKDTRPVVRTTGSHEHSCLFGAINHDGKKQLFRQYNRFNEDIFCQFLKQINRKFPKCYLFLDKAPQHYKSRQAKQYFSKHKDSLIPVWLPTASPEFMVLEECWNISKNDLLVLSYYPSFTELRKRISNYFRTKRFNLNMRNYLIGDMSP